MNDPEHANAEQANARRIFNEAIDLAGPARAAFLDRACAGDAALRTRVDRLLAAAEQSDEFLARPTAQGAGPTIVSPLREGPGTRIGPYKILQQIGEGGFGVVFLAEQETPIRRRVALKVIKLGMDTRAVIARFEAERQALALMDHPNIARVLDAGETETGRPYFVMELVKGVPITEYCDAARLSARQRLELFVPVCHAVQHAHHKGVIHRDLKPGNILVTLHDGVPVPKVIDFGIAKATQHRLTEKTLFTEHHAFVGTPAYMSPEQAEMSGLDVDTRTDVYSLGVLLYELLTGTTPFDGATLRRAGYAEMQRIIREVEPPKPSTRVSTMAQALPGVAAHRHVEPAKLSALLRGDLDWIIMRCLEKDRTRRYDTAAGLAEDIGRHLGGEAVVAAPPGVGYRVRKFVRRNRGAVAAAGLTLAALSLGIAGTSSGWIRARQQGKVAIAARDSETKAKEQAESRRLEAEQGLYLANLSSAAMALDRGDASEVSTRLDECPVHLRGFEWHLLKARSDRAAVVLRGHTEIAPHVEFSPDGSMVATGSNDGTVRLWEPVTGKCQAVLADAGTDVDSLGFSSDSRLVAAGARNGNAYVWDCISGRLVSMLRGREACPVWWISFAPTGTRLITTLPQPDSTTTMWDAVRGEAIWSAHHTAGPAVSAVFSPDGQLVCVAAEGAAELRLAATGQLTVPLEGDSGPLESPIFSPDGQYILGVLPGGVTCWRTDTGARSHEYESTHSRFCTFLDDGRFLHANPGNVFVQTGTGEAWSRFGWEDTVHPIVVHSSPLLIGTGSWDDAARIWDAQHDTGLRTTLLGHSSQVTAIRFSPKGNLVATAAWDKEPRIWSLDSDSGAEPREWDESLVYPPAQSHDGTVLAAGSANGLVCLWDAQDGKVLATLRGHSRHSTCEEFSFDSKMLVTTSHDSTARVWAVATGSEYKVLAGHAERVVEARFSPDANRVITGSEDDTARIWTLSDGASVALVGHGGCVRDCVFSPDGRVAATASDDGSARLWNAQSGETISVLGHKAGLRLVKFSPDGSTLATAAESGEIRVWDPQTGQHLSTLAGLSGMPLALLYSADGRTIVAGGYGRSLARRWNARDGSVVADFEGHRDAISSASFSPDGSRLVTASYDGTFRIWNPDTGRCLLTMRADSYRVVRVAFHPDGTRLFTVGASGGSRTWDTRDRATRHADFAGRISRSALGQAD